MDYKIDEWNNSYEVGDNILFYPHEEIIRFVSRYIRKRVDIQRYIKIRQFERALDFGCGFGRHMKYLDEMGFDVEGFDLSEVAVNKGKEWFKALNKEYLANKIRVANIMELPYESNSFDFAVSHGVLDSMEFSIAFKGIQEIARVMRHDGLMYFDVIWSDNGKAYEEEVNNRKLEQGTIQSYYDSEKLMSLVERNFKIVKLEIITREDLYGACINKRAHVICKKN